jgi:hypothetical protein
MFKSSDVACMKPSSWCGKSCITGIGYGARWSHEFSLQKSDINRTLPFFFGMIKVGAAHSFAVVHSSASSLTSRSISTFSVFSVICCTGNGHAK